MILSSPAIGKSASAPHPALAAFNACAERQGWPFACLPARDFETPDLAAACALWHEKAQGQGITGRPMPRRADLTARAMKRWMTHMSLIEHVEGSRYRVRLHGSALARYSGDATGKMLEEVIAPERLAGYAAIYDVARQTRQPLRLISRYQAPEIAYLTGESLVAPLTHGDDNIMILSITYPKPRAEILGRTSFD